MESSVCNKCATKNDLKANFCFSCGSKLRCLKCLELISNGAKFCHNCGQQTTDNSNDSFNSIEFHENIEGRSFKAVFTDTVGKSISESFGQFIVSKANGLRQLSQSETKPVEPAVEITEPGVGDSSLRKPNPNSVNSLFKEKDEKVSLIETRLKAVSKIDYAKRLTYLFLLFKKNQDIEVVPRADLTKLIESAGLNDGNYRNWIASASDLLIEKDGISLRIPGEEIANKILAEVYDPNVKDQWTLTSQPVKQQPKAKGEKKEADGTVAAKKAKSSAKTYQIVSDLNLYPKGQENLKDFFSKYDLKSNMERNAVFVYYLKKKLNLGQVTDNHIYSCYKDVGSMVGDSLHQSLVDTKGQKGWIHYTDLTNIELTVPGENFVEFKAKKRGVTNEGK